ncbi:MAG TPA: Asp-tRNA(Asn)/Glu-tRNA(Gln) amidotransferase subunit GatB [Chloroflexota bacterium]|nr:Asp-tRNA(Asn)/Glu-tRNA(Gln) amidotransferase subunit GatB [Chloroflexota bacterium]
MTAATEFMPVIGLEVHAQLTTRSKMFCSCRADYAGASPNSHTCPICSGMPGALPAVNARAIEMGILTALALNCRIPEASRFDRKNYSYPDLPKGYQITQYAEPIGEDGWIEFTLDGVTHRAGIVRVHLEEDTGKSTHVSAPGGDVTLVDYNRSGVPLMEIVSAPDLDSPDAARAYFAALRQILMYLGVNDGNLQEGSLRADVNVSLRSAEGEIGTKVEIKNLNSFRAVQRALEYEIDRQRRALDSGERLQQETRGWSETEEVTFSQRSKEFAHDYRYFPEPDLPPLRVSQETVDEVRHSMPELPATRERRFVEEYALSPYQAGVLTSERETGDFYERAVRAGTRVPPATIANWVTGDLMRLVNESGKSLAQSAITPGTLESLLTMIGSGEISGAAGKQVLVRMFADGGEPQTIVDELGLRQVSGRDDIETLVDRVIADNEKLVATYRGGKGNAIQALVGRVMGASRGRANPQVARQILEERLGPPGS